MEAPSQTQQSLPAPPPQRPPAEDAVSSRLAALKARLAAEKSKSSNRQPDLRRQTTSPLPSTRTDACTVRVLAEYSRRFACRPTGTSGPAEPAQTAGGDPVAVSNGASLAPHQHRHPVAAAPMAGGALPHVSAHVCCCEQAHAHWDAGWWEICCTLLRLHDSDRCGFRRTANLQVLMTPDPCPPSLWMQTALPMCRWTARRYRAANQPPTARSYRHRFRPQVCVPRAVDFVLG